MVTYQYTTTNGQVKTVQANSAAEALRKAPDADLHKGQFKLINSAPAAPGGSSAGSSSGGGSIVNLLNSKGQASDFASRARLAASMGIQNYTGSAAQNNQLFNAVNGGGSAGARPGATTPNNIFGQMDDPQMARLISLLPPELQGALGQVTNSVIKRIQAGQVVNPNIKLSPGDSAKLLSKATEEIDPYYKEQIGFIKDDLNTSLGQLQEDYQNFTQRQTKDYGVTQENQANSEANAGTAFSSGRADRQGVLADQETRQLTDAADYATRSAQRLGTQAERAIGSNNLGSFSISNYSASPGRAGVVQSGSRYLNLGANNVAGSLNKERETAIQNRKAQLEGNFRMSRNINLRPLS